MAATPPRRAAGAFLAIAILMGAVAGVAIGQASAGVLAGAGVGIAAALILFLLDRRRPPGAG